MWKYKENILFVLLRKKTILAAIFIVAIVVSCKKQTDVVDTIINVCCIYNVNKTSVFAGVTVLVDLPIYSHFFSVLK